MPNMKGYAGRGGKGGAKASGAGTKPYDGGSKAKPGSPKKAPQNPKATSKSKGGYPSRQDY